MAKKDTSSTGARKTVKRTSRPGLTKMGLVSAFAVDKRSPKAGQAAISVNKAGELRSRKVSTGRLVATRVRALEESAETSQFSDFTSQLTKKFKRGADQAKERALEHDGYATIEDGEVITRRK